MVDSYKLDKLKKLEALGIAPYPYTFDQHHHADDILSAYEKFEGKEVSIAGRILGIRTMGKLKFIDMLDRTGRIQALVRPDSADKTSLTIIELSDIGDVIGIKGTVIKTKKGEISVDAKSVQMLSKSLLTFPEKFHGLSDIDTRYRKRYLDLIVNHDTRKIFITRARIISHIRKFLDSKGYLEVETPVLQSNYGGANARPFTTHHNYLQSDFYLRISDELYLKRLIIGGFEKVYEFAKDFRNEDVDSTHNPEFTMLEFYEAYGDYNAFMKMTEDLISGLVKEISGSYEISYQETKINFRPPFKRIYFVDEIKKRAGVDISTLTDSEAVEVAKKEGLETSIKNRYHVADQLFDKYIKPELVNPTFLLDFPGYMCPLTKDKRGNSLLSERFEMFIAGLECGNCYSELTDPREQRKKFEEQEDARKKGDEEAAPGDYDFVEAMEYGMPPTAGIGFGIDRLVMLLTDSPSIKDTIFFPSVRPEKQRKEEKSKQ